MTIHVGMVNAVSITATAIAVTAKATVGLDNTMRMIAMT